MTGSAGLPVIELMGLPGAGKSTWVAELIEQLRADSSGDQREIIQLPSFRAMHADKRYRTRAGRLLAAAPRDQWERTLLRRLWAYARAVEKPFGKQYRTRRSLVHHVFGYRRRIGPDSPQRYILDEGVCQRVLGLGLRKPAVSRESWHRRLTALAEHIFTEVQPAVIYLNVAPDVAMEGLAERRAIGTPSPWDTRGIVETLTEIKATADTLAEILRHTGTPFQEVTPPRRSG